MSHLAVKMILCHHQATALRFMSLIASALVFITPLQFLAILNYILFTDIQYYNQSIFAFIKMLPVLYKYIIS